MTFKNILVAFDGSEASEHAITYARELMEYDLADRLIVLNVNDPSEDIDGATLEFAARMANVSVLADNEEKKDEMIRKISVIVEPFEKYVDIVSRTGRPQTLIIEIAKDYDCGLIVMGSRGLGAIRGALGSVSHAVLRDAHIPVFITK